ncbi:pyruvate:ferredoxin oxidoreductase/NADPH-cytochrome P450, partial [Reticulomyxa filosa]
SDKPTFTLAYGTATGNAKAIALEIAQIASNGDQQCLVQGPMELNALATKAAFTQLPERRVLVIVCSTTGDGEVPECAARFYRKLRMKLSEFEENEKQEDNDDRAKWLAYTHYAILGLGDSNYSQFNAAARKLDDVIIKLGAKKFYYTGMGDDGTGFVSFYCFSLF